MKTSGCLCVVGSEIEVGFRFVQGVDNFVKSRTIVIDEVEQAFERLLVCVKGFGGINGQLGG